MFAKRICLAACIATAWLHAADDFTLPELPPMPDLPPPREAGSVEMADPDEFAETKMHLPIAEGPFDASWQSIDAHYPTPDIAWLREAKFGIWVHFGPQSAGRSGDWYAKHLYMPERWPEVYQNHLKNFGHPSEVGYKDVLRTWNPEKLDPAALVKLYHEAGARFLFVQAVHHDNFDSWDSKYQPWNSVNIGPKRDLMAEWAKACRATGMRYGLTFHHEYSWWWYCTAFASDKTGPKAGIPYDGHLTLADGQGKWWQGLDPRLLYTIDLREYRGIDVARGAPLGGIFQHHQEYARWYARWWAYRIMDAIEKYDPDFIYTDGNTRQPFTGQKSGTGAKCDAMQNVIAHFFNRAAARRGKVDTFAIVKFARPHGGIVNTQENHIPQAIKTDQPWIGETAVGDWFYKPGILYDARMVVRYLLENTSRDGATAVCLPQRPDGSLDPACHAMLKQLGAWMHTNGEGIYGSKAWLKCGEGDLNGGKLRTLPDKRLCQTHADFQFSPRDFRFTVGKSGALYAYCMVVPKPGSELRIRSLGSSAMLRQKPIRSVKLLGHPGEIEWQQQPDALIVRYPKTAKLHLAIGLKIE